MATMIDHTVQKLNTLAELCIDSEKGFSEAAKRVENRDLRTMLQRQAAERRTLSEELRSKVSQFGEEPKSEGSVAGAAHRHWMKLKDVAGTDDHSILSECERGEDQILEEYEEAVKDDELETSARVLVQNQYDRIRKSHKTIRDTREHLAS